MSELLKEDELKIKSIVRRLFSDPLCSQQLAVDAGSQLQNLLNHYRSLQQENTALKAELAAIKQGEPVTWRQPISDGSNVYSKISAEDAIDSAKQQLIMFPDIDGVERCLVGDVEPLYLAAPKGETK